MFEKLLRGVLGTFGNTLLDMYIEHQLIVNSVVLVIGIYLAIRARRNPDQKSHYDKLKERIYERNNPQNNQ